MSEASKAKGGAQKRDRQEIHETLGGVLRSQAARQLRIPSLGEIIAIATSGENPLLAVSERTAWSAVSEIVGPGRKNLTLDEARDRAERYAMTHRVFSAVVVAGTVYVPLDSQQTLDPQELTICAAARPQE